MWIIAGVTEGGEAGRQTQNSHKANAQRLPTLAGPSMLFQKRKRGHCSRRRRASQSKITLTVEQEEVANHSAAACATLSWSFNQAKHKLGTLWNVNFTAWCFSGRKDKSLRSDPVYPSSYPLTEESGNLKSWIPVQVQTLRDPRLR